MALNAKQSLHKTWIVDSGASDHMTGDSSMFHTYTPCHKNLNIRIADGTLSKVSGFGLVVIDRELVLTSVLHVPTLDCNLFYVSKFTHDRNCFAKFLPCVYFSGLGFGEDDWQC